MADERDTPTRLGRFGRPVRQGRSLLAVVVVGAVVIGVALRNEIAPTILPPQTEPGADTITPTATIMAPTMPAVQPVSMATPRPSEPRQPSDPVMPANNALLPQGQGQQTGPRRVVSFAASRQPSQAVQAPATGAPASGAPATAQGVTGTGQREVTQVSFPPATMPGLRAGPAMDTTFVMVPGLYALVLDSPINSERGGTFFAHLPRPIKSPSGVVLMEEGSQIWGVYKSEVGPGQERIVTAAAWGMTPNGVPVPLGDSAVADGSGRIGMPGTLDTHFWARFGGAVTLMVTQGAFQAATAALQSSLAGRSGGNTFFNLNSGGIDQAIAAAVRSGAAIQSTVDVQAGKEVTFMLSMPIDFSDAYRLAPTGAR